jgi:hypothetical protein
MKNMIDPVAIEAALERDRASLVMTQDQFRDRALMDRLAGQALDTIANNWEGYLGAAGRAVRANPVALAMVAGGLAWLVLGSTRDKDRRQPTYRDISRWEGEGGSVDLPITTTEASEDAEWFRLVDALREQARDRIAELQAHDATSTHRATEVTSAQATILAELADDMEQAFLHGLEGMSLDSRDRILAARKQAYVAYRGESLNSQSGRHIGAAATGVRPVLTGALMLAAGASLVLAMRRSRAED